MSTALHIVHAEPCEHYLKMRIKAAREKGSPVVLIDEPEAVAVADTLTRYRSVIAFLQDQLAAANEKPRLPADAPVGAQYPALVRT